MKSNTMIPPRLADLLDPLYIFTIIFNLLTWEGINKVFATLLSAVALVYGVLRVIEKYRDIFKK